MNGSPILPLMNNIVFVLRMGMAFYVEGIYEWGHWGIVNLQLQQSMIPNFTVSKLPCTPAADLLLSSLNLPQMYYNHKLITTNIQLTVDHQTSFYG